MTQKEKKRAYAKKYYQEHKEELDKKHREFWHSERGKEYKLEYYKKNKDKIYRQQQEYFAKNREKVTKMMNDLRKRNAEKFAAEGQMYCYSSKTERENKMVKKLSKEFNISKEKSRELLETRDWNIKSLIEYDFKIYDKNCDLIKTCHGINELAEYFNVSYSNMRNYLSDFKKEKIIKKETR